LIDSADDATLHLRLPEWYSDVVHDSTRSRRISRTRQRRRIELLKTESIRTSRKWVGRDSGRSKRSHLINCFVVFQVRTPMARNRRRSLFESKKSTSVVAFKNAVKISQSLSDRSYFVKASGEYSQASTLNSAFRDESSSDSLYTDFPFLAVLSTVSCSMTTKKKL